MRRRAGIAWVLLAGIALVVSGCESTQSKSAKLEAEGGKLAKVEKIEIGASNKSIKVLDKYMFTDQYGTAIVLKVENESGQGQVDVPIVVNVKDAKGKSVYRNNIEGLEDGLLGIGLIGPGETGYWVNDQVLATGKPATFNYEIGAGEGKYPAKVPEIVVTPPKLQNDTVSGLFVSGEVTNKSEIEQVDLLLTAVATKGGKVVAAGRGVIPKLKTDGKAEPYRIYFIGDPTGAKIEVFAPPTTF
ncbi:MAG: hypothetical protein KDB57_07185 [Solirubrobacterales bacterium]|jgi:hypothetical protein|nr:hypothetical protein [Solirubrobacterales bacterium]